MEETMPKPTTPQMVHEESQWPTRRGWPKFAVLAPCAFCTSPAGALVIDAFGDPTQSVSPHARVLGAIIFLGEELDETGIVTVILRFGGLEKRGSPSSGPP